MGKLRLRELAGEVELYVRQLAWLHTAPDPGEGEKAGSRPPRIREWQRLGKKPPLPPCRAKHLVDYLFEVGPDMATGMGSTVLGWQEISAWQASACVPLTAWEAKLLRRLSAAYVRERYDARDPSWPMPMAKPKRMNADNRKEVERRLRKVLG